MQTESSSVGQGSFLKVNISNICKRKRLLPRNVQKSSVQGVVLLPHRVKWSNCLCGLVTPCKCSQIPLISFYSKKQENTRLTSIRQQQHIWGGCLKKYKCVFWWTFLVFCTSTLELFWHETIFPTVDDGFSVQLGWRFRLMIGWISWWKGLVKVVYTSNKTKTTHFSNVTFNKCLVFSRYPVSCMCKLFVYCSEFWTIRTNRFDVIQQVGMISCSSNKLGLWITSIFPQSRWTWKYCWWFRNPKHPTSRGCEEKTCK